MCGLEIGKRMKIWSRLAHSVSLWILFVVSASGILLDKVCVLTGPHLNQVGLDYFNGVDMITRKTQLAISSELAGVMVRSRM